VIGFFVLDFEAYLDPSLRTSIVPSLFYWCSLGSITRICWFRGTNTNSKANTNTNVVVVVVVVFVVVIRKTTSYSPTRVEMEGSWVRDDPIQHW